MRLIESDRKKKAPIFGSIASILFHAGLIAMALFFTIPSEPYTQIAEQAPRRPEVIIFIRQTPPEKASQPDPAHKPAAQEPKTPPAPSTNIPTIVVPPINIPDSIPPIDLTRPLITDDDFKGVESPPKAASGDSGTAVSASPHPGPFSILEVDAPPIVLPSSPEPLYPPALQSANVSGRVIAQFVINEKGKAEIKTFRVISASHPLFENAVRMALPRMRFRPGEAGGKKVRTLVELPFDFIIK